MRKWSGYIIAGALLFALAVLIIRQEPHGRPDIRIIARQKYATVTGLCFELQWSINGTNQLPAYFTVESERDRFEQYLATVGEVTE